MRKTIIGAAAVVVASLTTFGVSAAVGDSRPASVPADATPVANNSANAPVWVKTAAAKIHTEADFAKAPAAVRAYIQAPAWQSHNLTVTPVGSTPKAVAP